MRSLRGASRVAIALAGSVGIALAALAILQCAVATAKGSDRVLNSPQIDPTGARVMAAVADPTVGLLGSLGLAVAIAGYAVVGAFVGGRGGSSWAAATIVGTTFGIAAVACLIVEQILYPTAQYYFLPPLAGTLVYWIANLGFVLAVVFALLWAALAAGSAAFVRRRKFGAATSAEA